MRHFGFLLALILIPAAAMGADAHGHTTADLTGSLYGQLALLLFVVGYALVPLENNIHLRKSKPVLLAAGLIWVLVAVALKKAGNPEAAHAAIAHSMLEYAELFLFLLAAMTYINALEERNVFQTLPVF